MSRRQYHHSTPDIIKSLHDDAPAPKSTAPRPSWLARDRAVTVDKPIVFGILNLTPDSFSDGGQFNDIDTALDHTRTMVQEGADGIDIGGESTRPQGAESVSVDEELRRVIPVLSQVRTLFPELLLSVDTTKSDVAQAALDVGADIINDVSGFRIDGRVGEIAALRRAGVVLMHSRGAVADMGTYLHANYGDDVVSEVARELRASIQSALQAGIRPESIVVDPGIGFAKRTKHSLDVLVHLQRICTLGFPVMVGVSRKRFIGELSGVERPAERVAGTVGANVMALAHGARLFRVHDVAPNRQGLDVAWGIIQSRESGDSNVGSVSEPVDSRFPIPDSR